MGVYLFDFATITSPKYTLHMPTQSTPARSCYYATLRATYPLPAPTIEVEMVFRLVYACFVSAEHNKRDATYIVLKSVVHSQILYNMDN